MRSVSIYRNGALVADIQPDGSSAQTKAIMGDNIVTLSFELPTYTEFLYNDYCTVFDELYKINTPPLVNKVSEGYKYNLTMQAEYFDLTKVQFLFLGDDNTLKETDFSLMGTAETFIRLLLQNANRVSPQWKKGDVISTGYKNLTFSKENCLTVLNRIATEFGTEYWVEGKTIHLNRRRQQSLMRFHFGRNRGVRSFTRQLVSDSKIVTRLYAFGSDKNLPPNYRNGQTRLRMTGGIDYIEKNVNLYGASEDSHVFEDIYPHRTGKVTAVGSDAFTFFDATMDFDVNQSLLPGVPPQLTFNTGQLAGYTFKVDSYNAAFKQYVILKNTDEKALDVPSDLLKPAVGDEYVLTDIYLPQSYIDAAEKQVYIQASVLLSKIARPQFTYSVEVDPLYMERRGYTLGIGYEVVIQDTELNFDERVGVVKSTRNIKDEWQYQVEISDKKVGPNQVAKVRETATNTERSVLDLIKQIRGLARNSGRGVYLPGLPQYLSNAAALAAGRQRGEFYLRIGHGLDVVQ